MTQSAADRDPISPATADPKTDGSPVPVPGKIGPIAGEEGMESTAPNGVSEEERDETD